MKFLAFALICAVLVSLYGCATSPIPIGLPCSVGPIVLSPGASKRLTRDEAVQVITINNAGEQLCRWQPPKK